MVRVKRCVCGHTQSSHRTSNRNVIDEHGVYIKYGYVVYGECMVPNCDCKEYKWKK